ncbi:hypothetical protein [Kitasatospora sp. NPDC017646]|uniref:hypothetical protein n=1 Tax=Kitasatospora sp. NPDC017646 TaxID=3364024 RepID=UPI0037BAAA3E
MRMRKTLAAGLVTVASAAAMTVAPAAHAGYPFPLQCQYTNSTDSWTFNGGFGTAPGETICVNNYELAMQSDGNLVIYNNIATPIWSSGTWNHSGATAKFQPDGNFVIYGYGGSPALWASNTYGNSGATLVFQQDGNLVIYGPGHQPLWNTGT